ncbi:MAG: hypothetical protein R3321_11295, partial [Nitrososphaeraceae archaeon]|nr:hypothetical protein [Nitrososphaeraceae archaeon]
EDEILLFLLNHMVYRDYRFRDFILGMTAAFQDSMQGCRSCECSEDKTLKDCYVAQLMKGTKELATKISMEIKKNEGINE